MKILWLGPPRPNLIEFLTSHGDDVWTGEEPPSEMVEKLEAAEFIISYGYRHILPASQLERFPRRAINLHISLLPWNRGADPNLWSFMEETPKGVSIHCLDAGVDTGALLAQKEVAMTGQETLESSYQKLSMAMEDLFREVWPAIRVGERRSTPQPPGGSYHRRADRAAVEPFLRAGWKTPVSELIGKTKPLK